MKRVSFKVAKATKEAGYPQYNEPITNVGWYNRAGVYANQLPPFWEGDDLFVAIAPTYIEVWLWLWREKGNPIQVDYSFCGVDDKINDPEEAIISAIKYLVDNDLMK